ncbi:MAG: YceI family protein, partial [Thermomicrobiales bacterium]|nr:YceI family protein [Thermomicrobiales bacterium]
VHTIQTIVTRPSTLVGPLSLAAVGIASIVTPAAAQDAATPTPGVLTDPAIEINCNTEGDDVSEVVAKIASIYTNTSEESEARYRVQEELRGIGDTEAVGKTSAFIGQILFDANGMPLECSRFDVDLRTLVSDESRRDNYLYNNTLETGEFPLATFVLTSVEGLDTALVDGEETTIHLIGNLTVHGVTKLVSWEATVTKDGDKLTGSATTQFEMPDFDIEPPKAGPVVSLDETVVLEIDFTAQSAA